MSDEIRRLIRLYLLGILSVSEEKQLNDWRNSSEENENEFIRMRQAFSVDEIKSFLQSDTSKGWEKMEKELFSHRLSPGVNWKKTLKYAAIILPIILSGLFGLLRDRLRVEKVDSDLPTVTSDVPTLILANGEKIDLSETGISEIEVGNQLKAQNVNGKIIYDTTAQNAEESIYNKLQVPKGRMCELVLSDGTKVWVNAASELSYPVAFKSAERRVQLKGEAYFEVAPDASHPFYVETGDGEIRVLGTAFNVNTHYTRGVRTVLVEGKISCAWRGLENIEIQPGELLDFNREKSEVELKKVDVHPYISWKEGFFVFKDENLEEIMSTLTLWYDKKFVFIKSEYKELHFSGHLKRYDSIETILSVITEVTGVNFQINEHIILIN